MEHNIGGDDTNEIPWMMGDPSSPTGLPGMPLMSIDFNFETLRTYLDSINKSVMEHAQCISSLMKEVQARVTTDQMTEILNGFITAVPVTILPEQQTMINQDELTEFQRSMSKALFSFDALGNQVGNLVDFKLDTLYRLTDMDDQIKDRYTKKQSQKKIRKSCKETEKKAHERSEHVEKLTRDIENQQNEKMIDAENQFKALETNTVWKLQDCQNLLKVRVSEQYVKDAITDLEERSKKDLEKTTGRETYKLDRKIGRLKTEIDNLEKLHSEKLIKSRESIAKLEVQLGTKCETTSLQDLRGEMNAFTETVQKENYPGHLMTIDGQIVSLGKRIDTIAKQQLEGQFKEINWVLDETRKNSRSVLEIQDELETKITQQQLDEAVEELEKNQDPDFSVEELRNLRDNILDQAKKMDKKINKTFQRFDMNRLNQKIELKADDDSVRQQFMSYDHKYMNVDKNHETFRKDISALHKMIKQIYTEMNEMSSNTQETTTITKKPWQPHQCLSCGPGPNGNTILGRDGRTYKGRGEKPQHNESYDKFWSGISIEDYPKPKKKYILIDEGSERKNQIPLSQIIGGKGPSPVGRKKTLSPFPPSRPKSAMK